MHPLGSRWWKNYGTLMTTKQVMLVLSKPFVVWIIWLLKHQDQPAWPSRCLACRSAIYFIIDTKMGSCVTLMLRWWAVPARIAPWFSAAVRVSTKIESQSPSAYGKKKKEWQPKLAFSPKFGDWDWCAKQIFSSIETTQTWSTGNSHNTDPNDDAKLLSLSFLFLICNFCLVVFSVIFLYSCEPKGAVWHFFCCTDGQSS